MISLENRNDDIGSAALRPLTIRVLMGRFPEQIALIFIVFVHI